MANIRTLSDVRKEDASARREGETLPLFHGTYTPLYSISIQAAFLRC